MTNTILPTQAPLYVITNPGIAQHPGRLAFPTWFHKGDLVVGNGVIRWRLPIDLDFISFAFMLDTAPTGASAIFDIDLDGTPIYTGGARPTVTATNFDSGLTIPDTTTTGTEGQFLTVNIDQIGSTIAGADLGVVAHLREVV